MVEAFSTEEMYRLFRMLDGRRRLGYHVEMVQGPPQVSPSSRLEADPDDVALYQGKVERDRGKRER